MAIVNATLEGNVLHVALFGSIDSSNAAEAERELAAAREDIECANMMIDAENLKYISSAGLRIILRLRKEFPGLSIVNVSTDVYEILDMTGFTEMVEVHKAYRVFSVEGCEVIGTGANGKVYRVNPDTIVKTYNNPEALADIQHERELARTAFVMGIPTAIPYDVVRVGEGYGAVYELLDAKSFAQLLADGDKTVDEIAELSADLLLQIHGTEVKDGLLPDMRAVALGWAAFLADYLPAEKHRGLMDLFEGVPEDRHMLHGDFHIKNIMLQNDECLLIDMDTLCCGNPIFELGSIYNAYQGFALYDPKIVEDYLGIDFETSTALWNKMLAIYLGTDDAARFHEVEQKAQVVGLTRLIRRNIRRGALETAEGTAEVERFTERLVSLLDTVDTLVF